MTDHYVLLIETLTQHAAEVRALGHEELALIWQKQADDLRAKREAQVAKLAEQIKRMVDDMRWSQ